MNTTYKRCAELIDAVDEIVASSTVVEENGVRLVLSRNRTRGSDPVQFNRTKGQLLEELKNTFIEPISKSVRLSQLIMFCHSSGLELVTHHVTPHIRASALVRTPSFDIVFEDAVA